MVCTCTYMQPLQMATPAYLNVYMETVLVLNAHKCMHAHTHAHTHTHRVGVIVVEGVVSCHRARLMPAVVLVLEPLPLPTMTDIFHSSRHSRRNPITITPLVRVHVHCTYTSLPTILMHNMLELVVHNVLELHLYDNDTDCTYMYTKLVYMWLDTCSSTKDD